MLAVKHTRALEVEIDRRVYALYGLTPEEIALVEGQSREEREAPPRTGWFSLRRMAPFARNYALAERAKRRKENPRPPFALPCGLSEKLCSRQARKATRRKACFRFSVLNI